jgi:hypothetical protein
MRPSQILTFLDNVLQAGISKAEISHSRACSDILPGKNSWDFPRSRNKYSYIMTPKTKGRKTMFAAGSGIDLAGRHDDCFNQVDILLFFASGSRADISFRGGYHITASTDHLAIYKEVAVWRDQGLIMNKYFSRPTLWTNF